MIFACRASTLYCGQAVDPVERLGRGEHPADAAIAMGFRIRTVNKWKKRFSDEGAAGLHDRSSRPRCNLARPPASGEALLLFVFSDTIGRRHQRTVAILFANRFSPTK